MTGNQPCVHNGQQAREGPKVGGATDSSSPASQVKGSSYEESLGMCWPSGSLGVRGWEAERPSAAFPPLS